MKKTLLLISTVLILSACVNNTPATSTPAPVAPAPAVDVTPAPAPENTEKNHNTDTDDPIIEYYDEGDEIELVQITESFALTNAYFGVTYVMPESWFVWFIDEDNLNEDPALTKDLNGMNVAADSNTGETFIDFFEIGSNHDEALNDHLSVGARAVFLDGKTMDEYLDDYKKASLRSENVGLAYEGDIVINGVTYRRLVFVIFNPADSYDDRMMDTFSIERNGHIIIVRFDGWVSCPENESEIGVYMSFFVMVD